MRVRSSLTLTALTLAALAAGCGGGGSKDHSQRLGAAAGVTSATTGGAQSSSTSPPGSSSTSPPASSSTSAPGSSSTSPPGSSVVTGPASVVAEAIAQVTSHAEQQPSSGRVLGLAFRLAAGGSAVDVSQVEVASAGTVDETALGAATLIDDANGNGEIDSGEAVLATAARAAADDAPYVFTASPAIALQVGAPRRFIVALDAAPISSTQAVAFVGSTTALSIASATAVHADDAQGAPVTPSGTFPITEQVALEVNDTVLITEIATGFGSLGTSSEFVELWNASGRTVDLSTCYLSDFTDQNTVGKFYWKLPTGQDFTGSQASDFFARFPAGTTIAPGRALVVAIDGGGFKAAYGADADFMLRNISAARTSAAQMLTWDGVAGGVNFTATPVGSAVSLTGPSTNTSATGEAMFLFDWDGRSDLVKDVDIVHYGSASAANGPVDKSPNQTAPGAPSVRVDSLFDQDTVASTYLPETSELAQADLRAPMGLSIHRVDFTEGAEKKTGGNGLTGNDETSEPFGALQTVAPFGIVGGTFQASNSPTPRSVR